MREVTYRGKRADNGEWIYGNLLRIETCFIVPFVTNGSWIKKELMLKFLSPCYEVDAKTVGEFSGVKDINGKEMYEGDIIKGVDPVKEANRIKERYYIGVIEWQSSGFVVRDKHGSFITLPSSAARPRVLGNKLENPDLLEVD